ncbi:hypothetical protein B0H14DRAFT_3019860 [Mycena olivaceomarginata]|nr:hypothetical protein B0H14DRAFT_3019860 [Mycena olivaceomarginata]
MQGASLLLAAISITSPILPIQFPRAILRTLKRSPSASWTCYTRYDWTSKITLFNTKWERGSEKCTQRGCKAASRKCWCLRIRERPARRNDERIFSDTPGCGWNSSIRSENQSSSHRPIVVGTQIFRNSTGYPDRRLDKPRSSTTI